MRVLHVAPDLSRAFGGPTEALLGFVAAARAAGIKTEVIGPMPPAEDLAWFERRAAGTPVHAFAASGPGSARLSSGLLRFLATRGGSFDVVHVHGMFNAISTLSARACRRRNIPYVIGPFGTLSRYTFEHKRQLVKRAWHALLDAPAIRGAGAMHFTTVHERDEARRLRAVRGVPAAVVPPPWLPDASGGEQGAAERAIESPRAGVETVLYLSRLNPIKGLETLIDAWPAVRVRRPGARLVIAGAGDPAYERAIRARAAERVTDGSITFAGFVKGAEKARLLAEADVFALTSYHENFGVAVIEAIAAGLPAVITPEVQVSDVVVEHALGTVVPRAPAEVARGIVATLEDSALRARVASVGPQLIPALYTLDSVGERLRAMYELAIEGVPVPRMEGTKLDTPTPA